MYNLAAPASCSISNFLRLFKSCSFCLIFIFSRFTSSFKSPAVGEELSTSNHWITYSNLLKHRFYLPSIRPWYSTPPRGLVRRMHILRYSSIMYVIYLTHLKIDWLAIHLIFSSMIVDTTYHSIVIKNRILLLFFSLLSDYLWDHKHHQNEIYWFIYIYDLCIFNSS